jgi:hypothetical protein
VIRRLIEAMTRRPYLPDNPLLARRVRRTRLAVWLLIIVGGGITLWGRHQGLSDDASHPTVTRETSSELPALSDPAPEVRFLLAHRDTLGLTDAQAAEIKRLQAQWSRESVDLRRTATDAASRLSTQVEGEKIEAGEVRGAALPLAQASAELASRRREYWNKATDHLTPDQRVKLEPLLRQVTLADLLPEANPSTPEGAVR